MRKPKRRRYLVRFMVPQLMREDEERIITDPETGKSRPYSVREQAEDLAISYLKTVAQVPQADDMLHGLIESVKPG